MSDCNSTEEQEQEADEPQEDDYTTSDHCCFYQYGKQVLHLDIDLTTEKMWEALDAHMVANSYWPNVWFISDHGNCHLMDRDN